jgi:putative membrane protein
MNFIGRSGASVAGPGGPIRFWQFGQGPFGPHGPLGAFVILVLFVIVLAAIALLVTLFIRRSHFAHRFATGTGAGFSSHWHASPTTDALRILNERFARGEIDADDYKERRDLLQGPS